MSKHKQSIFSFKDGAAVLQWPDDMKKEDFLDFKEWLEISLRVIERSVNKNDLQPINPTPEPGHENNKS